MAILPICIVGEPVLHQPTTPVPLDADGRPSDEVVGLIDDMYETMDAAHGVGLDGLHVQRNPRDLFLWVLCAPAVLLPGSDQGRGPGGLDAKEAWQLFDPAQGQQVAKAFVQPADDTAVADGYKDDVGSCPRGARWPGGV